MKSSNQARKRKNNIAIESDPRAHHKVLSYLRRLWNGERPDPKFEQKSLNNDLKFNSLNLAALIYIVSQEHKIPTERIVDFLAAGIPGGGDQAIATLLKQIVILAKEFDESERFLLLATGAVGDGKNIGPIIPEFDNVGFVVKYCKAIIALKGLEGHDARDIEFGEVDEDEGW